MHTNLHYPIFEHNVSRTTTLHLLSDYFMSYSFNGLLCLPIDSRAVACVNLCMQGVFHDHSSNSEAAKHDKSLDCTNSVHAWLTAAATAGCTFTMELLLGWNVAYVATHKHRKQMILKRTRIACFYVFKGTFVFDIIATSVFIAQVICIDAFTFVCMIMSIDAHVCLRLKVRSAASSCCVVLLLLFQVLQYLLGCMFVHKAQQLGQIQACMQAVGYGLGLASSHGGTIIQIIQIARVLRSGSN